MKKPLKVFHCSDIHGDLHVLKGQGFKLVHGEPDLWIVTGDFQKNFSRGKSGEGARQFRQYLKDQEVLRGIFEETPVLCMDGNHDFCPVGHGLRRCGINAIDVTNNGPIQYGDWTFAGFPHINYIIGEWNYESLPDVLRKETNKALYCRPDVLVTHSPPAGILDGDGIMEHHGLDYLSSSLQYGDYRPKYHFFGHVHECGGQQEEILDCLFVNSATTVQCVMLEEKESE